MDGPKKILGRTQVTIEIRAEKLKRSSPNHLNRNIKCLRININRNEQHENVCKRKG